MMSNLLRVLGFTLLVQIAAALSLAPFAFAQEDADDIENLFNKEEQQTPQVNEKSSEPEQKTPDIKDVSDLGKLSTFNDVAVIQRRYLPKTGRFEIYGAPSLVLNDAFFMNFGVNGRIGYNFAERYGIEITGFALSTSEREVTKDLREKRGVRTTSLITPKSYIGLDFKYTPIYGKMTWKNATITPFDLYFSVGAGMTGTNQGGSEPTLHIGTGQIFALSKGMAFRWDFSWNMFTAESSVAATSGRSLYNTLLISTGVSFFFPEAKYR
jgi:outer membrane beta-barrel protein